MIWRIWAALGVALTVCVALRLLAWAVAPMIVPLLALFAIATLLVVPYRGRARKS